MSQKPAVIFLHGLARTRVSMERLRWTVAQRGYATWSCTYPSRERSVKDLARDVSAQIRRDLGVRDLVAVTHSMGGILVRHMDLPWRGVVMLAPPNRGSRMAESVSEWRAFQKLYGPAGLEMARPGEWPLPAAPTAVIAGTGGVSPTNPVSWLSAALKVFPPDAPHDGTVAVHEAHIEGLVDFATVPASHTWIMEHPEARKMVLNFIESGKLRG